MQSCGIILPNQLYQKSPFLDLDINDFFLVEEYLFFKQFKFHKQKLAYHIATMNFYADYLNSIGKKIYYVKHFEKISKITNLINHIYGLGYKNLFIIDPVDNWIEKFILNTVQKLGINLTILDNPGFILRKSELQTIYQLLNAEKKVAKQTKFYIYIRKKLNLFVIDNKPIGGKWSFDTENRKKMPSTIKIPDPMLFNNKHWKYAFSRVIKEFSDNPGDINYFSYFPITFIEAQNALNYFLENKLCYFGAYQDFIDKDKNWLFHSNLSAAINVGLLTPNDLINNLVEHYYSNINNISFNNVEGYIRQIVGWREYIRFTYEYFGTKQRNSNFFNLKNSNLKPFLNFEVGLYPLDVVLNRLKIYAYNHHIERLMIIANIMNLLRINPNKAYEFFMTNYIDAYDWVMVPNVYGMGLFADGGLISTKPYICSSNYLIKMSNFKKDSRWNIVIDSLFWCFIHDYKEFFVQHPRMSVLARNLNKINIKDIVNVSSHWLDLFR